MINRYLTGMKDENKTKKQLINELVELRQRISKLENSTPTSKESQEPWSLKIFTLGRFSVIKDGKLLQSSRRVPKQTLLMLKALIAFGGRGVAVGLLADIFWSRAEGDAAHSAFTTALHRLRQLIGKNEAIRCYDGKLDLDPRYVWIDLWEFKRILGQVDTAWNEGLSERNRVKVIDLAEKGMKMYTGPFLTGENEAWMIPMREHLRSKFLRNVGRVALYWEQAGELNKAVNCYQRGLEADELEEEFYQRLMKCYRQMGKRAEAIAIYKRCCQILSAVLGIEPSPETEVIYKTLLPKN